MRFLLPSVILSSDSEDQLDAFPCQGSRVCDNVKFQMTEKNETVVMVILISTKSAVISVHLRKFSRTSGFKALLGSSLFCPKQTCNLHTVMLNMFSCQHGASAATASSEVIVDSRTGQEGLTEELFSLADIFRWLNISLSVTFRNTFKEIYIIVHFCVQKEYFSRLMLQKF